MLQSIMEFQGLTFNIVAKEKDHQLEDSNGNIRRKLHELFWKL